MEVLAVNFERNVAISLLKLTAQGPVLIENVKNDAHLPLSVTEQLLKKMQNEGLIYLDGEKINVESGGRLKLAVKAATQGADIEQISRALHWQEFEEITATALKENGYAVHNNVRFTHAGRRMEIDVVACRKPLVVCVDCKRWQKGLAPASLRRVVEAQVLRTKALANSLPSPKLKLECTQWERALFVPVVLSLVPSAQKFCGGVPVVAVLQLRDFVDQLPLNMASIEAFPKVFTAFKP
jgi:Holliday junction resolvase-like predicted endonuclease